MAAAGGLRVVYAGTGIVQHTTTEDPVMDLANPHFAEPQWLWFAVVGPVLVIALQRYSAWARRRQLARLASPEFLAELTRSHSPARRALKNVLLVLAMAGIGLANTSKTFLSARRAGLCDR